MRCWCWYRRMVGRIVCSIFELKMRRKTPQLACVVYSIQNNTHTCTAARRGERADNITWHMKLPY